MELLSRLLTNRLKIVIGIVFCAFSAIVLYLFHLQVNLQLNFFRLGQQNFLRYEKISSPRGNIIDAEGNLLATNRPVYSIHWQGRGERKLSAEHTQILETLQEIIPLQDDSIEKLTTAEKQRQRVQIAYDITFEQLSRILEYFPNHKNIIIHKEFKRFYPHKQIASHVVGYLGLDLEATGKMGLELVCNDALKGQSGEIIKIINSIGHNLASYQVKQAHAGDTLQTNLNLGLQLIAEEVFPTEYDGTCIVLNPRTGAVEVILSRPSFDPNIFLRAINPEEWQALQEKKSFINRALSALVPPASLFKFVTLSAALESYIITPETRWYCFGYSMFADRAYRCSKQTGHGALSTEQALAHSCNIPFFEIAKKIKIDTLAEYAYKLGLGAKTNILFHEKTGLVPTSAWKKKAKGERWWPGETLSAAIGQSFILVTPMQIACMISALCESYFVQPRILALEPISKRPIALRSDTLHFIKGCMEEVIKHGTGLYLRNLLQSFKIYGKTGTAQTCSLEKSNLGKEFVHHAWFAAYFRYKDHDPHTLVVLIENAGSSSVAIKVAQKFLKKYAELVEQKSSPKLSAPNSD